MATAGEHPREEKHLTGMEALAVGALYGLAGIAGALAGLALVYPSMSLAAGAALVCGKIARWLDS